MAVIAISQGSPICSNFPLHLPDKENLKNPKEPLGSQTHSRREPSVPASTKEPPYAGYEPHVSIYITTSHIQYLTITMNIMTIRYFTSSDSAKPRNILTLKHYI